jgi:hypothetical protein
MLADIFIPLSSGIGGWHRFLLPWTSSFLVPAAGCFGLYDGKFIASLPETSLSIACRLNQGPSDAAQYAITHGMAVGVVDGLERIYIEHAQDEIKVAFPCFTEYHAKAFHHGTFCAQSG